MATFVDGPVTVSVPATSANLGPGFDCLGLALSLRDDLTARVTDGGLSVELTGDGADSVPRDESHLVVRAMRAAFDVMGEQPPGLELSCVNRIPHGRGLGSSSAAIVAGVSLARALVAGGTLLMDDDAAFSLCARMEGHPDNVAPAFHGGFVISGEEDGEWFAVPSSVDPRISVVVLVPEAPLETTVARGLLPEQVAHAEAAANSGRAALLVAALASQPEWLLLATRDWLHQEHRSAAMPDSLDLVHRLRADGVAAVLSGAGPTVLAFCDGGADSHAAPAALLGRSPRGWTAHHLQVDTAGVRLS